MVGVAVFDKVASCFVSFVVCCCCCCCFVLFLFGAFCLCIFEKLALQCFSVKSNLKYLSVKNLNLYSNECLPSVEVISSEVSPEFFFSQALYSKCLYFRRGITKLFLRYPYDVLKQKCKTKKKKNSNAVSVAGQGLAEGEYIT